MLLSLTSWRFWAPLVTGYATSALCGGVPKTEGEIQPQRPPPYVFGIVWPVLYLLLGLSWAQAASSSVWWPCANRCAADLLHGVCTGLLVLWLLVFSCGKNKKAGIYVIACALACVTACMALADGHTLSVLALVPLWAWLFIAFHLNWHAVDGDDASRAD